MEVNDEHLKTQDFFKQLSKDEQDALSRYKSAGFRDINGYLYGKKLDADKEKRIQQDIALIRSAIQKSAPLKSKLKVYRGLNVKKKGVPLKVRNMYRRARKGSMINNPAFFSTSLARETGYGFASYKGGPMRTFEGYFLEIAVPKGTHCISMESVPVIDEEGSGISLKESELLFDIGTNLKVLSKKTKKLRTDFQKKDFQVVELKTEMIQ